MQHQVIIAGAGPTGMMLAAELKLAGIDAAIVERRTSADVLGSRARGLNARTLEVLDQRGIANRFLAAGYTAQVYGFGSVHFDISDFPTRHPYGLALLQKHTERLLADWIDELGVKIYRGREVAGFAQDETGVDIRLEDGEPARALHLVGCDGGRSVVRRLAGIAFEGWDPTISHILAEVEVEETPPKWGLFHDATGMHGLSLVEGGPLVGVMITEPDVSRTREPTLDELREAMIRAFGSHYGAHSPAWLTRFTDMARQAVTYRQGRVLLAGDAAHIHYPAGGKGLNTGLQDAVNLGWKLAQVVKGVSSDTLLDTYTSERHPVAAGVLRDTLAHVAAVRTDARTKALNEVMGELLALEEPRRMMGGRMSGLDIRYELGEGHPLMGRRMPDLDLLVDGATVRVSSLLREARPLLLEFGATGISFAPDRVRMVAARTDNDWLLPVIGKVRAPSAVLVRPDGHVAWVGEGSSAGLMEAAARWFGG